jgi:hypothetical protein
MAAKNKDLGDYCFEIERMLEWIKAQPEIAGNRIHTALCGIYWRYGRTEANRIVEKYNLEDHGIGEIDL